MINVLKVLTLNAFTDEREKLWAFLIKLKLYIEFNQAKFRSEMNKGLFTVLYLKNAAFNWVNLKLHEFLNKTSKKWMNNKKFIFNNYKKFKNELQRAFEVVNKKQAAKRWLHILKMNKLTVVTSWSEMPWILGLEVCACWYKGLSVRCRVNQ